MRSRSLVVCSAPAGLAVALTLVSAGARADEESAPVATAPEPDPAAATAADANLEPTGPRDGFTFAAAIGAGTIIGIGVSDSVGRGPSVDLRLGRVAGPNVQATLELEVVAALHRRGAMDPIATNTDANVLAGMQYYASPSLWVRGALGGGVYTAHDVGLSDGRYGDRRLIGPSALFGVGVDLARFKAAVFGIDLNVSALVTVDGVLLSSGGRIGVAFD